LETIQEKKTKGQGREKQNYKTDGSLSTSNPARALDTFSGYHGQEEKKLGPKASNTRARTRNKKK